MTAVHPTSTTPDPALAAGTPTHVAPTGVAPTGAAGRVLAVLRIAFGFTFLWAFLDKLLALGYSTGVAEDGTVDRFGPTAWIHGGSPTQGFLAFGADGPFTGLYHSLAGNAVVDVLFMGALLGLGVLLITGVGTRVAGIGGAVLYVLMWTVALPPTTNPLIDEHVLGAISLVLIAVLGAGDTWGLGRRVARFDVVRRFPVLR